MFLHKFDIRRKILDNIDLAHNFANNPSIGATKNYLFTDNKKKITKKDIAICINEETPKNMIDPDLQKPRIYSIWELNMMPAGTIFHHSSRGPCYLYRDKGQTLMFFDQGYSLPVRGNYDPWNKKMLLIFCENRDYHSLY